jgi:hypothetical protein
MGSAVQHEISNWKECYDKACVEFGQAADLHKNPLCIALALQIAWDKGIISESLLQLVKAIIEFAVSNNRNSVFLPQTAETTEIAI